MFDQFIDPDKGDEFDIGDTTLTVDAVSRSAGSQRLHCHDSDNRYEIVIKATNESVHVYPV
jgi:hypothetical protein